MDHAEALVFFALLAGCFQLSDMLFSVKDSDGVHQPFLEIWVFLRFDIVTVISYQVFQAFLADVVHAGIFFLPPAVFFKFLY